MSDITRVPVGVVWWGDGQRDWAMLPNSKQGGPTDYGHPHLVRPTLLLELVKQGIIDLSKGDCGVTVTFPDGATGSGRTVEEALQPFVRW